MKKTIHIKLQGHPSFFNREIDPICKILEKNYDVIYHENSEAADYLICGLTDKPYSYCEFEKIRIMYSGENYVPDFNFLDYAISSYPIEFLDRHYCFPICVDYHGFGSFYRIKDLDRSNPERLLKKKIYFANSIIGHESEFGIRGGFFKKLNEYKRVESPGWHLNNMPNGEVVSYRDGSKQALQSQCKFTLCFESTKHEGFVTEKITDAFCANTIPIYYGSDTVKSIFNPKAFIHCSDYDSFDEVIEKIKEIDQDDEKWMAMMREPILLDENYYEEALRGLEKFLCNIFDQDLEKAYRRSRVWCPKKMEDYLVKKLKPLNLKTILKNFFKKR